MNNRNSQTRVNPIHKWTLLTGAFFVSLGLLIAIPDARAQRVALPDFSELVEKEGSAVVNVSTKSRPTGPMAGGVSPEDSEQFYEFFRRFMPPEAIPQPRQNPQNPRRNPREPRAPNSPPNNEAPLRDLGQGSGFIISSDGFIITNRHVVLVPGRNPNVTVFAEEVKVTLSDKREFKAKVIGADERTDVAVLKIEATGLPKVTMGNSDRLKVGEWVLAIGSPFGFESTVTAGIVSAKSRETGELVPFIQTDAAVNPGNSGGPLYNTKGEVVGVNSQIFTGTGGYLGISFAIPSNTAMEVANQLMKSGKVQRSRIGIVLSPAPITEDLAEALGLPKKDPGVMVDAVESGAPADKAGLKSRDVIQKVDGKVVRSNIDIQRLIFPKAPGSKVTLSIWRNGATKEITTAVMESVDAAEVRPPPTPKPGDAVKPALKPDRLGLILEEMDDDDRKSMSITQGVIVTEASGPAARAGLRPGDAILMVNSTEIKDVAQFNDVVAKLDDKRPVALLAKRDDTPARYVTLRPETK